MSDSKIRLVYSSLPSSKAVKQRNEWGLRHAQQLGLFDDFEAVRVILIPISNMSAHSFRRALSDYTPKLIVDTRKFPDFFSIFSSIDSALGEFSDRGIEYNQVLFKEAVNTMDSWELAKEIKAVFISYFQKRTGAPVFVLASTEKLSNRIERQLEGYLSQENVKTKLESIST
ncbi:hypothetical protein JK202_01585 [Gluconobacter sp. Dm-62]|uniref:hypothetical protein n=1 Tax=Gluconobacter sp. Dm-62 TaxID=2799804 RepID=UPI001B8C9AD3|nr:hypothetical protein [Gluconobacter sp. Dm-62]MBS1101718.1 hypothetical protein [Gluconobacter sp. Dm-62]